MFAGYSTSFWTYAVLKFICSAAMPCIVFSSHSLIIEIFRKEQRKNAVIFKEIMWPLGSLILVPIFYYTRHWTHFHLWTGGICALAFPALLVIPESPRWLSVNSKVELAEREIFKMARWNGRCLSTIEKRQISSILGQFQRHNYLNDGERLSIKDMFNSKNLTKTLIMMLNWITVCVTCFTLSLNVTTPMFKELPLY